MSELALSFGGGEQLGPHPFGEALAGAFGGAGDGGVLVGCGTELDRLGARVVDGRSAGPRAHAVENTGHGKSLTMDTSEDHNKSMTTSEHVHRWVVDTASDEPNDPQGYVYCEDCGEPR